MSDSRPLHQFHITAKQTWTTVKEVDALVNAPTRREALARVRRTLAAPDALLLAQHQFSGMLSYLDPETGDNYQFIDAGTGSPSRWTEFRSEETPPH